MNEEQLRPLIVRQSKWAFKTKKTDGFAFNMHKVIVFLTTANKLLEGLKEFFVPLLPLYFDKVLAALSALG